MTDYRQTTERILVNAAKHAESALRAIRKGDDDAALLEIENLQQSCIRATASHLRYLDGFRRRAK